MSKHLLKVATLFAVIGSAHRLIHAGANWGAPSYALSVPAHVSGVGQVRTGSINLLLQHDVACSVSVSVAQAGNEILTFGGHTLDTAYMLTGAALQGDADATWVTSSTFINRLYHIAGTGPNDTLTLGVRATAPSNCAPPAGDYTASLILTVSW